MGSTPLDITYIVEHLDPELGDWSTLEYEAIARESAANRAVFYLSSVPTSLKLPHSLSSAPGFSVDTRGVEEIYSDTGSKQRICLLDPAAETELSPDDASKFKIFLFGGILGTYTACSR